VRPLRPLPLAALVRSFAVTVRTNDITLGDFGLNILERTPGLTGGVRQIEALLFAGTVVKVHDVVRVPLTTIGTGTGFGLTKQLSNTLEAILFQSVKVVLVALIILALVGAVTTAAPVLRLAIGPHPEFGQRQLPAAAGTFLHGALLTSRAGEEVRTPNR
jgi:hypothetical protein